MSPPAAACPAAWLGRVASYARPGLATTTLPHPASPCLALPAEWSDAWRQRYSADPLLRPPQHASARELAERRREGGKGVTLAECLEVGRGGAWAAGVAWWGDQAPQRPSTPAARGPRIHPVFPAA